MTVGERLVQLREEKGFKVRKEFAKEIDIPETTLRNYEKNDREPGHTFLKQISEYFNVSVDYILGLTDEKDVLHQIRLRDSEQKMIQKYRALDDHGQELVDVVLEKEYARCKEDEENTIVINEELLKSMDIENRLRFIGDEEEVAIRRVARRREK